MPSPRDVEDLLRAARLYYVDQLSQQQIATAMRTSRSNVSRMLTAACDAGLVEIRIVDPGGRDGGLEQRLRSTFGLREARVAARPRTAGADDPLGAVGALAARLLTESVTDGMTVALSWGTALQSMVWAVRSERPYAVQLAQLVGGLSAIRNEISGLELVRELSVRLGADHAHYLHAPATFTSRRARDSLLAEASVAQALDHARRADVAFVGIGTPAHGCSSALLGSLRLSESELRDFWARGPVGDVAARYVDAHGEPVTGAVAERVLAVGAEDLRNIPTVVGVAAGSIKAAGVLGALRGRLIDVLVCDEALARAVLAADGGPVATPADPTSALAGAVA